MLLALFLVDLAAGLVLFLPLVGRRNAGVKFYRLVLVLAAALVAIAGFAHWFAKARDLAYADAILIALTAIVLLTMRYPKRLVFRVPAALLGVAYLATGVLAYDTAVRPPHFGWSIAGAIASIALLGTVNLAMTLGHWYLVVRGMSIEPLKRLTIATLVAAILKVILVFAALIFAARAGTEYGTLFHRIVVGQGIFFWMRAGWGLLGPLLLYPMVWGTVKIRSTMAATGILYVDVVAVVIGEVLGAWLSRQAHLPL